MSGAATMPQEMLAGCHGSHLAAWLPALQPQTIERLCATPRLAARLHRLLAASLPPVPSGSPCGPLERLALRPSTDVAEAGRWMGALWHARAIGRCIAADEIAILEAAIGREVLRFALRQAVAMEDAGQAPDLAIDLTGLAARLIEDGQHLLERWLDLVAPAYRALAILRLPLVRPGVATALDRRADQVVLRVAEAFADAG